jgi:hypothetical protein
VPKVLANIRWKGLWVKSSFRNIAFVNCDLRGTYFSECSMMGVAFVNCLLDGTIFSDCSFKGRTGRAAGDWAPEPLSFIVPADERGMVEVFAHYRELGEYEDFFLSPVPPLAAQPALPGDHGASWAAEPGGVTMYGGRLSALVIRSCEFDEEAKLSLRHVSGSGLDIVEQDSVHLEIFGSALRHLTITTALGRAGKLSTIESTKSALSQVWIGGGVSGVFDARDSMLVHVWNGSPNLAFTAVDCPYEGLVNVTVEDATCRPIAEGDGPSRLDEADPRREISGRARNMDYRRNPAMAQRFQPPMPE